MNVLSKPSPFASTIAPPCLRQVYPDPIGDSNGLDADQSGIVFNCSDRSWAFSAHLPVSIDQTQLADMSVNIDRDNNAATGCAGADLFADFFYSNGVASYDLVETPTCQAHTWHSLLPQALGVFLFGRPFLTTETYVTMTIPDTLINQASFRWSIALASPTPNSQVDYLPDTGMNIAVRPSIAAVPAMWADFNGDHKNDIAIFRLTDNTWHAQGGHTTVFGVPFVGGVPVPGDYNGDGKTDIAVFDSVFGTWLFEKGVAPTVRWGEIADLPVPGDYNGDKKTDLAVFRPSNGTWYIRGIAKIRFGQAGDVPIAGDFNADGRTDIAVFRPSNGTWYIRGKAPIRYGQAGDMPLQGDFNGDKKTDIAVFRPANSTWYIRGSRPIQWGTTGDVPVPGDFNADGKNDIAIFRPSNGIWYDRRIGRIRYGRIGDIPL